MSIYNRLFLFAGFNKDGIIDDATLYYIRELSKYGRVIVCMDCDCKKTEFEKTKKYSLVTIAYKHGEYDFGSYKRAFQYACSRDILEQYDYLYLVNDSVFGPFDDIFKTLIQNEKTGHDAAGLVVSKHKTHQFMESWFIRLNKKIFTSQWFEDFINSVQQEKSKAAITVKYEHGLSKLIKQHGCSWGGLVYARGRFTYNNPKKLFKNNIPFIKKASFTRHNGSLGGQVQYILKHSKLSAKDAVMKTANQLYGKDYMDWFLTSNPLKIFVRKIKYFFTKIKNGDI